MRHEGSSRCGLTWPRSLDRHRSAVAGGLSMIIAALALSGCVRPPVAEPESGPLRLAISTDAYGAHDALPEALVLGSSLSLTALPLADGGEFELGEALGAGPVMLVWVSGAEHAELITWVRALDGSLAALDARGASLVFVRPLGPESALAWAIDLGLQATVAADPYEDLAPALGMTSYEQARIDFAVLVLDASGTLRYRKLGARRPGVDELAAALDGIDARTQTQTDAEPEAWRCCPGACVGEPCVPGPG